MQLYKVALYFYSLGGTQPPQPGAAAAELEDNGNDRLLVRGPPPWHRCHTHGGTALRLPHRKTYTPLTAPRQAVEARMGALEAQLSMSMDDINSKLEALIAASS